MTKLTRREKIYLQEVDIEKESLRNDPERRLRNALCALASMDKAWMIWVETHVPVESDTYMAMRLVEMRARELVMCGYRYLGESVIKQIIGGNRPFGNDGTLLQG